MEKQKTIKKEICFSGIGVHSGKLSSVCLKPASGNSGIILRNINFKNEVIVVGNVLPIPAMHATVIKTNRWIVSTIEHIMAAINCLFIDNLIVEITGTEIPILDGSCLPFVQGILSVGIIDQKFNKKYLTPRDIIEFKDGSGRGIKLIPAKRDCYNLLDRNLYMDFYSDFKHKLVGKDKIKASITTKFFIENIAPARTFGFLDQLSFLKKNGLGVGTSLGNTVVISDEGYLNDRRFSDECIRHKLLDLLGDLALLGIRFAGKIEAKKTGHNFNHKILEHFMKNSDKWMVI